MLCLGLQKPINFNRRCKFFHQPEDKELFERRIVKEAIHEVGHMLGLMHCPNRGCVMIFSNTIGDVDKKTKNLCEMCSMQLSLLTS